MIHGRTQRKLNRLLLDVRRLLVRTGAIIERLDAQRGERRETMGLLQDIKAAEDAESPVWR